MAHQPPFTDEQTNQEEVGASASSACAQTVPVTCFTLANGFPAAQALGNYALNPHYGLPYLMAWNLDIQKTLPLGIVMNLGYNGTRANHQDTVIEPRAVPGSPLTDPNNLNFRYEEGESFSKFHAATVRVNKRLQKGIALGANYQYSHSIDDAGALGSVGGVGVQNWQNVLGELGNSSLDIRHTVSGTYLYELPFGEGRAWATSGAASHILEGFSVSGTFKFATGGWLSPSYQASITSTSCGTGGVFRPNLTSVSPTAGGGSLHQWFNPAAYALPPNAGSASYPYPCGVFGNAPRNSIEGPGTVSNNMALSRTVQMGETRSLEMRASINNVFNTVQYSGVGTTVNSQNFGQVTSVGQMRTFQFMARFRF
jgi:trimeric autotransporter adhesin